MNSRTLQEEEEEEEEDGEEEEEEEVAWLGFHWRSERDARARR